MKFRRLKHMLLRLSNEEKVLGIGALLVLIGTFLPWYSVVFNFNERSTTESGFSGDLGVIGFIVFLLTAMTLAYLIAGHTSLKIPSFGYKKEKITMFLMGESAFLLLLTIAIYTKRALEYTNAEIRFGLYLSLIGAVVGAFSGFAQIQKLQKKDVEAFFEHPEEARSENEIQDNLPEPEAVESKHKTIKEEKPVQAEQKSFFYEEAASVEEPIEDAEPVEIVEESIEEQVGDFTEEDENPFEEKIEKPADETIEDTESIESIEEEAEEIIEDSEGEDNNPLNEEIIEEPIEDTEPFENIEEKIEETVEEYDEKPDNQGGYFIREAGVEKKPNIKVDIDSIKQVEKAETEIPDEENAKKEESSNQNMSFYDDL